MRFSRYGFAFTPAFGRAEACFARDFYGTAEVHSASLRTPLRFVLSSGVVGQCGLEADSLRE